MRAQYLLFAVAFVCGSGCGGARIEATTASTVSTVAQVPFAPGMPVAPTSVVWRRTLDVSEGCTDDNTELLVPFLEGIHITHPARALPQTGYAQHALGYPGVISAPFIAWRCGAAEPWAAVFVESPDVGPVRVSFGTKNERTELGLECFSTCTFRSISASGGVAELARAVANVWTIPAGPASLSSRYDNLHFYVHQFVGDDGGKAPRVDFDRATLVQRLAAEPPRTTAFVYGLDPASVDLGARYLWSDSAHGTHAALRKANPAVAPYSWLNLRTFKHAIPALELSVPITPEIESMKRIGADGSPEISQYAFKGYEMCLGSAAWQDSRMKVLEELVAEGFQVIALDEFPVPTHWDVTPCKATNHLHRPSDVGDEYRVTMELIARISAYAKAHGVMLSSEEPSLALLPHASAYMDGAYNEKQDFYELWMKSPDIALIPLFSTMFGDRITPTTRPDPRRELPRGWMPMKKMLH